MNSRERMLAMIVLGLVVLGGLGFMVHQFILAPLAERRDTVALLEKDLAEKQEVINGILAKKPKLELWRRMSLPADTLQAQRDYDTYLTDLFRKSGFERGSFTITPRPPDSKTSPTLPGKKEPIYTRLTFLVQMRGTEVCLADMLERFYRTSLLHQIKSLDIKRPYLASGPQQAQQQQRQDELEINMKIEALVLTGAEKRVALLPGPDVKSLALEFGTVLRGGPAGIALVPWAVSPAGPAGPRRLAEQKRNYLAIAGKNVFFGSAPAARTRDTVDVTQFVFLTDISRVDRRTEATLYDRYNNRRTRLRTSAGFNSFRVLDDEGEALVQATVVQIDDRDLIFRVGEKYYTLHLGQSLQEVLEKPLKEEQMKSLGLGKAAATRN